MLKKYQTKAIKYDRIKCVKNVLFIKPSLNIS